MRKRNRLYGNAVRENLGDWLRPAAPVERVAWDPQSGAAALGGMIQQHGTAAQKQRWLPPLLSGEERWHWEFTGLDTDADATSLRSTVLLDNRRYVIHGRQVWACDPQACDWFLALMRAGPGDSDRQGLTALAIPMNATGLTTKDLTEVTCTYLSEVVSDDVIVPVENRIGPENEGWALAMTALGVTTR